MLAAPVPGILETEIDSSYWVELPGIKFWEFDQEFVVPENSLSKNISLLDNESYATHYEAENGY